MTENEQLEYNDALVYFASIIKQHGVRRVLLDLQAHYPKVFLDIKQNIDTYPDKPVAVLLRK